MTGSPLSYGMNNPEIRGRALDESVPASDLEPDPEPVRLLRAAIFSDSLKERNGTGAYYHDLAGQLRPRIGAMEVFQPLADVRHPRLAWPMPGDPTQKLISPNVPRIWKAFMRLRPNVVVAVTPGPFGLLGLFLARRLGCPFISAFHTDFEALARLYWNPVSRTVVNAYLRTANRIICRRSGTVLVNNSKLRPQVEALGARAVDVMGTPLHEVFVNRPVRPPTARFGRVCFAGRLAAEKNIGVILEAAAALPEIEFELAGDGPQRAALEREAGGLKNVRLHGWLDRAQLIELIDRSDCLLLPSHFETFGSIAFEAMARGRPPLVSAGAGIHDWSQLAGGLYTLAPDEVLTDAIRRLAALPLSEREAMAERAREAALGLHEDTIAQWASVLSRHARPDPE